MNRWEFAENSLRWARCERGAQASPESALILKAVFALLRSLLAALRREVLELGAWVIVVFTFVFRAARPGVPAASSDVRRLLGQGCPGSLGTPRRRGWVNVPRTKMTRTHHFEALCRPLCTVRGARRRGRYWGNLRNTRCRDHGSGRVPAQAAAGRKGRRSGQQSGGPI